MIQELKKGSGRKMVWSGAQGMTVSNWKQRYNHQWSIVCFELDSEKPKTHIGGETIDISQICEYAWYDWVFSRMLTWHIKMTSWCRDNGLVGAWTLAQGCAPRSLKHAQCVHWSTY